MGSGVDLYAYRELVKDKGGMRHGTKYFYSNLNLSRMCMWEEVERQNREEDMKQALHERIALYKSLGQYWDNLRNENKRALVKSCLNAEDLQNFIGKNTPVIEFLTKLTPKDLSEYTILVYEYGYFLSGPTFLEIAQSDTLKLGSEKFFSFLDGASESTWLLGGSPKVEHVLDHCMEVLKIAGDGDVIASSCLRIEQKLLEGYIQAEANKKETRNRRTQKKKERNAGNKNRIVQDISGLLNTNTVDNSTKGDAKVQGVLVNSDVGNLEVEAKVVGEARSTQIDELGSQTLDVGTGMARDYCAISSESLISEEARQGDGASMFEPLAQPDSGEEDEDQSAKDVSGSATARTTSQLQSPNAKSKKQEASGPSSPSSGVFSSVVSSNQLGGSSSTPSGEAAVPQTMAMEIRKERNAENKSPIGPIVQDDISGLLNTNTVDNSTKGDAKIQGVLVNSDVGNLEVEAKVVGEARSSQIDELGSQTLDIVTGMARDYCAISSESLISEEARQGDGASMFEPLAQPDSGEEDEDQSAKDVSGSATARTTSQLQSPNAKSKKQETSGPSSPSPGVFSSVVSSNQLGGSSSTPSGEAAVPQTMAMEIRAMQDMMKKLMDMHEKLQEQMAMMKAIEADNVAMWVQRLEEFPKQVTGLIDDFVNKDFGVMLEKKVKNELADIKDAFVSANTLAIEQTQTVPLAVSDYCQSEVRDKAVNQLENLVKSKLEATIAQFRTLAKQVLEDALRSIMDSSMAPSFLRKCRATLDLLEAEFLKRIESAPRKYPVHTKLVKELNLSLSSAIGLSRHLSRDLIVEQRNLVSEAVKVKLSRLVSECKYDEAFSCALERDKTDIGLVPWLCSQVDLQDILVVQVHNPLSITSILKLHVRLADYYEINPEACIHGWMVLLDIAMDRFRQIASEVDTYRINQGRSRINQGRHDLQC